jgi:hypothetical protein
VGVAEVVEGVRAGWTVGVGRAVYVDVHAAGEDLKRVLRGWRGMLRAWLLCIGSAGGERCDEGSKCEDAEGLRQAVGLLPEVRRGVARSRRSRGDELSGGWMLLI